MQYQPQYFMYKDLVETGKQTIKTKDINGDNIENYFDGIINIFKDGIEKKEVQNMMVHIIFADKVEVDLTLFDFVYNVMFWILNTKVNAPIESIHIIFPEDMTKRYITNYIDTMFIDKYRDQFPTVVLNQTIDEVIGKFRDLRMFQMYLANTLNLKDTIDLMEKYPDFNATVHFDVTGIPLSEVKDAGLKATQVQIDYIKNSDHCLRDSFRTGEAISAKQYKEVAVNIGSKPDGQGSVFPHPIAHSFMNGGLKTPEEIAVESSVGRVAQILQKTNVGESGAFARKLELNNQDTFLNPDPDYVCDTHNFEEIVIEDQTMLNMFDLRYYRENPNGVDKFLKSKYSKDLVGKKLYFRSPMTCASVAKGHGICRKCYGDLYFVNREVNVGQIASEGLSSIYTQILLSAKHLLESAVVKMVWTKEFYDIFNVEFNTIGLDPNKNYKNWHLIINEDIEVQDDLDEIAYNRYITSFIVKKPDGEEINIHTENSDNIYLVPDLIDFIDEQNQDVDPTEETYIDLHMEDLVTRDLPALFIMEVKNNELSATMDKIEKLIDNKSVIEKHDRNTILRDFVKTNISGGITLNSVHFEVLLMNQFRSVDDDLEMPDWSHPDAPYVILSLRNALSNNRSVAIRLQSDKIQKALTSPQNRYIHKPATIDLFYMEQPQLYLSEDIISDENVPVSDKDDIVEEPIKFENPKIKVGRKVKKRRL